MTNLPQWMQSASSQHRRKRTIRNVRRVLRLAVILFFMWLVYAFCVAVHFTPVLTAILCALAGLGVWVDLSK